MFVKTVKHELRLPAEYQDSLEQRVARLLTNDLGETLRCEVSYALIQEFKKFMFIVALDILENKKNCSFSEKDVEEDKKAGVLYYTSKFSPPYHLDLVWRFLIHEGQVYKEFCNAI